MQNAINHSDEFGQKNGTECDKQFSHDVIIYQNQVEEIIAWLYNKEEELRKRPHESTLNEAAFSLVLEEYSRHEKFISELCEYSQTIMKCKESGQEMRENGDLTEEDRDEIGIQMDAMMVCNEKLKFLSTDRLRNLQKILEERQQIKIERFEEWLSLMELKIASSNNIGPDYNAILRQMKDLNDLTVELEQKQDFLNFMSSVIIFDEVDSESLQIRSRSCESLESRLDSMNRRWTDICKFVDDRSDRLKKAESIWKILNLEGPQLTAWLDRVTISLREVSEAAQNVADLQADKAFIGKLLTRSEKMDLEIKTKQSFYTSLESRVRIEIEKFDDPCSMLVIELEKYLEDLQDNWNAMMNQKRLLDYKLQALSNPAKQTNCNMIPLPEPITPGSNPDLRFEDTLTAHNYSTPKASRIHQQAFNELISNDSSPPSSGNDDKESSLQINSSYSEPKAFDNSLSSDTRSLIYGNTTRKEQGLFSSNGNDSQDELSTTSMTASYPIQTPSILLGLYDVDAKLADEPPVNISKRLKDLHLTDYLPELENEISNTEHDIRTPNGVGGHNCRVEEWKLNLESFSSWLKQVETSLNIDTVADSINDSVSSHNRHVYLPLKLLDEIEDCISSTYQDEFDCLILQGQQIIEDLMPEIGENKYEADLKKILADIEYRYSRVKGVLDGQKRGLCDRETWLKLLRELKNWSDYLIEEMDKILPETNIGIDLITLAQQQDQLMHAKANLEDNEKIKECKQEAKFFFELCDNLQQQYDKSYTSPSLDNLKQQQGNNYLDLWLTLRELREDIEVQLDRLSLHYSELSQLIEDRLARLDEVHKEMHALQHRMQELATKLQVAEILKSNWVNVENLTIEQLSEQLEDLKLYRERLSDTETNYKLMNDIFDWMTRYDVPLSQSNLKRINELTIIWSSIQNSVEDRQKLIEQAFDSQGASEQRFLEQTVADLSRWERRVATSKVPYYFDHSTNTTKWDHPKFTDLLKAMSCVKQVVFAAYRTALKLRMIQKKFGIDLIMLEQLKEIMANFNSNQSNQQQAQNDIGTTIQAAPQGLNNNDTLLNVEQVIFLLKAIYDRIQFDERPTLDVPLSIDLTLNWLLNLYDTTRTGYISVLGVKVGLTLICCATREEKYIYMYELVANPRTGTVDARKLGTLFEACMRVPVYLGEGDSFGGAEIIETSIRNCFSMSKFNPQHPNCIDLSDYLNWLKSEPQFIIWLPVLHRLLISESIAHHFKCKLCGANPFVGLRYRCLRCFGFNICQNCFLVGRHIYEHQDPAKHQMREYCSPTGSGENFRDFTKILRNKMKPGHSTTKQVINSKS